MKKAGRGGLLWLTRNPTKDSCPEEHRDEGSCLDLRRSTSILNPSTAEEGRIFLVPVQGSPACSDPVWPPSYLILQSAGSAQTAIRGRSTGHRNGIPCAPPSLEFLRLCICANSPSRWFRLRSA